MSRFGQGDWIVVPVIARIESHRSGRWWGYWFSKHTPEGLFKEVPVEHVVALESDDDADELLRLIRGGRELPAEFVQRLPCDRRLAGRPPRPGLHRRTATRSETRE